jgi:hypothetical protein
MSQAATEKKEARPYYYPSMCDDEEVLQELLTRQPFVDFVLKLGIKPSDYKYGRGLLWSVDKKFTKCSVSGCSTKRFGCDGADITYGFDTKGNVVCDCGHHHSDGKNFEENGGLAVVAHTCGGIQITSDYPGPSGG